MKPLELVNQRFERLIVQYRLKSETGSSVWMCLCDCGNNIQVRGSKLTEGRIKSCGCLKIDTAKEIGKTLNLTHGRSGTPEYSSWSNMKDRCLNENATSHRNYGGRGIAVCERWKDSFENFHADMGNKPSPNHSIERNDVNGHYEPGNCRWATKVEQENNRRNNVVFFRDGVRYTKTQLCALAGVNVATFDYRIKHGKTLEEALR